MTMGYGGPNFALGPLLFIRRFNQGVETTSVIAENSLAGNKLKRSGTLMYPLSGLSLNKTRQIPLKLDCMIFLSRIVKTVAQATGREQVGAILYCDFKRSAKF